MTAADLTLIVANLIYATSYAATRLTLADVPPATLALARVLLGALILVPLARAMPSGGIPGRRDRYRMAVMGIVGFAAAFALGHWGLARSTATNAALLITAEPLTLLLLGPWLLGERLTRRENVGAGLAMGGAVLVVVNGVPGVTEAIVPHWRGDVLLVLSGVAYAAYSLLGRPVLSRHPALPVTAHSIVWGIPALLPLAALEWADGRRPAFAAGSLAGTLYLGVVITALGYLVWNWALERVPAARAAIFLNLQPVVGAALGVLLLGEPLTPFTVAGAVLVVTGLILTVRAGSRPEVYSSCE
jgi:drug/metabolite transporter (DMT)-like permease